MNQIIHPSHVCHRFANPQDPAAYISASNLLCSTSVYCFTSRNLPWKKCTLPKNRSSKASDFLCSSVKDFGTNRSRFKDNCAQFFAVFTESSDLIFKRRFDYFEVEKCRKWRCQQSNGDQFRVFSKRKLNAADTYSTKTILLGKMLDIRWRGRVRLILRHVRKWSFLANYKIWLKSLQKNWRQVGFLGFMIFLIGISCVYLGMTASLAPQEVPYSNLVTSLKSERVTTALFEEGSRVIYFNVVADTDNSVNFPAEQSSPMAEERQVGGLSVDGHGSVQKDLHLISGDSMGGISVSEAAHNVQQMEDYQSTQALIEQKNFIHKELQSIQPRIPQKYAVSEKSAAKGWTSKAPSKAWQFSTRRIKHDESFLLGLMRESGVTYSSAPQSVSATLRTLLITVLTLWIPLSPLLFLLHRQLSTNSASTRKRKKQAQFVKFDDVAGVDAAKEELMEIVSCLRGASTFKSLGAKLPKGILLVGPPGTGKTLLARAVASEAGVPFFAASASEFVEMFVGRGAARVRDLFAGARKCSPSIIFLDEIDAVGCKRGRSFNDERDQTLNQLLTELDGFESEKGVVVIAATNRPEALDPALCRPGRFSRKVLVKEPDFLGRCQILAVHMRGIPLAEDAEMIQKAIASITPGLVGADLANIVNEAAMLAARQGHSAVNLFDFKEATNRVKYGIGDASKIGTLVESEINRLFGWMSPRSGLSTEAGRGAPAIPTNS